MSAPSDICRHLRVRNPGQPWAWVRAFAIAALLAPLALPAASTVITNLVVGTSSVTLTFQNDGTANQFTLQQNLGLGPGSWANAASAVLTPLGSNRYTFVVPRSAADREFFRIIASFLGTGLDPDNDGLPTALEQSFTNDPSSPLWSNPSMFDTDQDGFSDGIEYALGTQPNNPLSKPDLAALPVVRFAAPTSSASEGDASPSPIIITGTNAYTGPVYVTINSRSTAATPAEFSLTNAVVSMVGGVGQLSLNVVDNEILSPERLIILDLAKDPPGNPYRAAGAVTHVVSLSDNDNYWNGVLQDANGTRNFRVRLRRQGSSTDLAFVSGTSDGMATPDGGASSQSTGVIPSTNLAGQPQEVFVADSVSLTATTFTATSPALPASTMGAFAGVALKRVLTLTANSVDRPADTVMDSVIVGTFTEAITHATDPSVTYLNSTTTGLLVLTRDLAGAPVVPSAFVPN